ncbi:MAG: carboxypeptidase regulatory-like domain-containing protein [Bryobacteraceae bacterium]
MRIPIILIMAALSPLVALYGADEGSISGTITDPSSAVMPATVVSVRNPATGMQRTVLSNAQGFYAIPALAIGEYQISIEQVGFAPYQRTGLVIDVNTALQVDVQMQLGSGKEAVTVAASAARIETSSSQLGQVVAGKEMREFPLNGRSYTDLLSLQPGVAPATTIQPNSVIMTGVNTSIAPSGDLNPGNISISGMREYANGFTLNGSNVEEHVNMGTAVIPNLDSIAEFRILTSNFDAEYGDYSGGQIIVVTKSGGNQLHGGAFEFLRNTDLDSRNFFSTGRAKYVQNQFGGTVGGPIKHDKIFFFGDYQETRRVEGLDTGLIPVPSLQDRTGDLSDLASSLTGSVNGQNFANLLSQKLGYAVSPGEPYYTPGCTNPSQCVLPNAEIPQRAWSAPASQLLQYIPAPNTSGNYFSTSAYNEILNDGKGSFRVDGSTRWGLLSAYYFIDNYFLNNPYPTNQAGANVPGFNAISTGRTQLMTLGDTKTFGSSAINEFRVSFIRDANDTGQPVGGVGVSLASQGFVTGPGTLGIVPLDPKIEGVENVVFNNFTLGVNITGLTQIDNTYQVADGFSKVLGTHTLKMGGEYRAIQVNVNPDFIYNGSFSFFGSETGVDFADFLLGIPSNFAQGQGQAIYERNKYSGAYVQDSWRVAKNLTLNYGVRWDRISPWSEKYNQIQTLKLGEQSIVFPTAPRGLVFPGDPGIPNTLAPAQDALFSPRVGLAFAPDFGDGMLAKVLGAPGKVSVRAGYGLFYTAIEGLSIGVDSANIPYGYSFTSPAPPLFSTPYITAASGTNNGQPYPLPFPPLNTTASHPDPNVDFARYEPDPFGATYDPGNRTPYAEQYSLTIERQFSQNDVFSIGYVGTEGHRLLVVLEENPGNPALCLSLSQPSEVMPGTPTCGPFGESGTYVSRTGQVYNGTRGPFGSAFSSATTEHSMANSSYNALEVTLRHTSGRGQLLASYTFSKSMDQSSSLAEQINPLNYRLSRAPSSFNIPQNFIGSYQCELPFDRLFQRKNRVTSGWSLSGIVRLSEGFPVTLFNNGDTSLLGTEPNGVNNYGVDLPNYTPGPLELNGNPRNGKPYFNTSLFSVPELGEMGTAAHRFFYGPGMANFDIALLKTVPLTESKALQFRMETFNTFNHAQFFGAGSVNGVIGSPAFGTVVSADAPRLVQLAAKFTF